MCGENSTLLLSNFCVSLFPTMHVEILVTQPKFFSSTPPHPTGFVLFFFPQIQGLGFPNAIIKVLPR